METIDSKCCWTCCASNVGVKSQKRKHGTHYADFKFNLVKYLYWDMYKLYDLVFIRFQGICGTTREKSEKIWEECRF